LVLNGLPRRGAVTEAELATLSGQPINLVIGALPILCNFGLITASREGYRLSAVRASS
jgi:hypothetical protein